jgi:hypothetical protein
MRKPRETGMVRISADVVGGRVVAGTVCSDRPRGLAGALARHRPDEIPELARRLFALCGMSHYVAATKAIGMAGAGIAMPSSETAVRWLAAERIAAHLQTTFIGWRDAVPLTPSETAALSIALIAARRPRIDVEALLAGLTTLGLSSSHRPGSWAARLRRAAGDGGDRVGPDAPDPLTAADDDQVLAALIDQDDAFAAAPWLPGRRPETGPASRAARHGLSMVSAADRLGARLTEIVEAARLVVHVARSDHADWITARRLAPGLGFCAIETPRGRLHHLVQLGPQGSVQRYAILAPTEWNFAAEGPFATALHGLWLGAAPARPAIERLASLYDPCVGTTIEVRELAVRCDVARRRYTAGSEPVHGLS